MSNNASTVAATSKHDLLLKKREELGTITRGYKRKLREYLAVAQCDPNVHPLPVISTTISTDEQKFLDDADITKGRSFQESSIPARRQLRSHTSKLSAPTTTTNRTSQTPPSSVITPKPSNEIKSLASSRHATPSYPEQNVRVTVEEGPALLEPEAAQPVSENGLGRRGSRGSKPTDGDGIDTAMDDVSSELPIPSTSAPSNPSEPLEQSHVLKDSESRPVSRAKDSQVATPVLAEEEEKPSDDRMEHQHLPLREESGVVRVEEVPTVKATTQERRDQTSPSISLQIPKIPPEAASSPDSTSGPLSATTPALHEASTDTSPDNEALQYDTSQTHHKPSDAQTPTQLPSQPEEEIKQQSVVSVEETDVTGIVRDRPSSADAQLQLDTEQAAAAASRTEPEAEVVQAPAAVEMTRKGTQTEMDIIDDEDEVMGVPTPHDEPIPSGLPTPVSALDKAKEIPDSQESQQTDQMANTTGIPQTSTRESRASPEKQSKTPKELSPTTSSSTPRRTPSVAPPIERMTTRVSSGAIRNRSVSEIIGEKESQTTSTPADSNARKPDHHSSKSTSRASTPQTPLMRSLVEKAKEKERSKLSTVIFAKQPAKKLSDDVTVLPSGSKSQASKSDDYLKPLLESQISEQLNHQPLQALIQTAHKTLSTHDSSLPIQQIQMIKILRRVQHLQEMNKWSLRQPKRSIEPNRPTTHRDLLVQEMRWMRTDFREERKWKMRAAKNMARDCALYRVAENYPDEQAFMRVKLRRPTRPRTAKEQAVRKDCYPDLNLEVYEGDVDMADVHEDQPTPDLIPSGEESSPPEDFDDEIIDIHDAVAPTQLFILGDDDVTFHLRRSPATEKMLEELPLSGSPLQVPQSVLPTSDHSPDAHWKRPILPMSKYADGQIVILDEGPPRKKSRYDYDTDDDDDGEVSNQKITLPPENSDVALFNPENKHIRDRIHAGHQFRPPSEFPMPTQSFFESRESSQWTKEEEVELKRKVREYSYNWSLIASELQRGSARSCTLYATVAERRTPWECFERWVSMEGLPQDMEKTTYFRAYTSRLATAERNLAQAQATAPQQVSASAGGALPPARRPKRSASAIRVDRRRNAKHLHLVDAMRKNAKKKESAIQKQLQAATLAKQRKTTEQANNAPRVPPAHKPQDFSKLKHDREVAFRERVERYQQQQLAQRQAQMQQVRQAQQNPQLNPQQQQVIQQQQQQQQLSNGASNGYNLPNGVSNSQNLAVPGQNRTPMHLPVPNPNGLAPPMSGNGVPQAQMQNMQNLQGMRGGGMLPNRGPAPFMAAKHLADQQRAMVQQQNAQGSAGNGQGSMANLNGNPQNSPPNMRNGMNMGMNMGMNINMNMNQVPGNQSMRSNFVSAFNNPGAMSTPPVSMGLPPPGLQQGSPRMSRQNLAQSHHFNAFSNDIRGKHPNFSPAEVEQIWNQNLQQQQHSRSQNAMHAAAGGAGSPISGFNAGSPISSSMPHPMPNGAIQNGNGGAGDRGGGSGGAGNGNMMRGGLLASASVTPQTYASTMAKNMQQQQMHAQQQAHNGNGYGRSGSLSGQNQGNGGQNGQGQNPQLQGNGNGNGQQSNGTGNMKG